MKYRLRTLLIAGMGHPAMWFHPNGIPLHIMFFVGLRCRDSQSNIRTQHIITDPRKLTGPQRKISTMSKVRLFSISMIVCFVCGCGRGAPSAPVPEAQPKPTYLEAAELSRHWHQKRDEMLKIRNSFLDTAKMNRAIGSERSLLDAKRNEEEADSVLKDLDYLEKRVRAADELRDSLAPKLP